MQIPIIKINQLDTPMLVRADNCSSVFHLKDTLWKVKHPHGMVIHPSTLSRKFGRDLGKR